MPTPARRPKRSPRRLRKFYAMIVKVFTLARVAKLADARDLKSRVPKGTYRFNSGPGHHALSLTFPTNQRLETLAAQIVWLLPHFTPTYHLCTAPLLLPDALLCYIPQPMTEDLV